MKIAILGGTGAMGSMFGGKLFQAGYDVTLVDINQSAIAAIRANGLQLTDKAGAVHSLSVKATINPAEVEVAEVVIVFVKGFATKNALENAQPFINEKTRILTLQNGWGHSDIIGSVIGSERMALGVTYSSGVITAPGCVSHIGSDLVYIGNFNRANDTVISQIAQAFDKAGLKTTISENIILEIWKKLALNVCTLPTTSIVRLTADLVPTFEGLVDLMKGILKEVVSVANASGIVLDYEERLGFILNLLHNAKGSRSSMLQDFEACRPTEIDYINGAIAREGGKAGIATPYNHAMVCLIKSIQENYLKK